MRAFRVLVAVLLLAPAALPLAAADPLPCDLSQDPTPCEPIGPWIHGQADPVIAAVGGAADTVLGIVVPLVGDAEHLAQRLPGDLTHYVGELKDWPRSCVYYPDSHQITCSTLPHPPLR